MRTSFSYILKQFQTYRVTSICMLPPRSCSIFSQVCTRAHSHAFSHHLKAATTMSLHSQPHQYHQHSSYCITVNIPTLKTTTANTHSTGAFLNCSTLLNTCCFQSQIQSKIMHCFQLLIFLRLQKRALLFLPVLTMSFSKELDQFCLQKGNCQIIPPGLYLNISDRKTTCDAVSLPWHPVAGPAHQPALLN